ncbi:hypothetical protein [Natronoarchaeum rubrum]|uniref:hypothetical protein n=1 Tax=Natronoarchaeum rubrum TaxID=755311 RepID=UPI002112C50F|nr:hypothetical protein [Natronoarchaeum rubrum]HMB49459.1 hypothetical protein [Natronoarchaeum rubrum]
MLGDALEFAAELLFDAVLDRDDDRSRLGWALLFVGTVLCIGGLALAANGRLQLGIAVLAVGVALFAIGA